ncbi:FixH family protein [Aerophototrophica crusticola]|uniref:FixH family protein n=1 Tax=Aerophototrophica crusticola TaxID=1709002 RepID=A0A858R5L4_9PROT|nr:FixH family protein [Rhodospirillaceae bacterium B3]
MVAATPSAPRKSTWIPWVFVGAMAVVVAVNGVMITAAVRSFSGLAVSKPFERGLQYNKVLDVQHRQDALGWKLTSAFTGMQGLDGTLTLTARDQEGKPLEGVALTATLQRPLGGAADITLDFLPLGDGRYAAPVSLPAPGQWELHATLVRGTAEYYLVQRVVAK